MTTNTPISGSSAPGQAETHKLKFVGSFITWILTGFGAFRKDDSAEEVVVYTVDKGFYLWAMILTGFIGAAFARNFPSTALFFGWVYVAVIIYTMVLLLRELNTWRFVFWIGVIIFLYLIVRYPLAALGILPGLSHYLANLNPHLNPDFASVTSWGLMILFFGSVYVAFANGRKTITPNSIEEWHFGRGRELLDRGGLRFQTDYPDVLESILGFGAGDLVAYDRANRIVKRYHGVLFLFFKWNKLDLILHQKYAIVNNVPNEAVEVHEVNDAHVVNDAGEQHDVHDLHAADDNQATG